MGGILSSLRKDESSGPKSFYLLLGGPSIRYSKGTNRGPLIFDVDPMRHENADIVQHAETQQTICHIPSKQTFVLRVATPGVSLPGMCPPGGYTPRFTMDCLPGTCPTSIKILVSVKLEYRQGVGLVVLPSDPDNEQFCVYEQKRFNKNCDLMFDSLSQPIRMEHLTPCPRASDVQQPRSLLYCPIVIVLESDVYVDNPVHDSDDERAENEVIKKHIEYTFLNFKKESLKKAKRGSEDDVEMADMEHSGVPLTFVKQYLQVENELYDLDDIYDLGGDAKPLPVKAAGDGAEGDGTGGDKLSLPVEEVGADVDDVCVICLSNPKDTTILPCRHMCLCSECAAQLRTATNKCPICRQVIGKLMTMHI